MGWDNSRNGKRGGCNKRGVTEKNVKKLKRGGRNKRDLVCFFRKKSSGGACLIRKVIVTAGGFGVQ